MPTQLLTVSEARTIRQDGAVELVTHDAFLKSDRSQFGSQAELNAYLAQVVGGKPDGAGIRGSMSRKGRYSRRAADGSQAVTFGDPVLDTIASPAGTVIVGNQTIDLRQGQNLTSTPTGPSGGGVVALNASSLKLTGIVHGAERWAADDLSMVEYRVGNGRLTFHAWKKDTIYLYWSMGGEISVTNTGTHFEAADIWAFSYMTVPGKPPCEIHSPNPHSSNLDDNYLDNYDWGWHSQQPEREAVLCRAQWHHARFREVLIAGEGCFRYQTEDWPLGFPPEWDMIQTVVDLNGNWTDGSNKSAIIAVKFKSLNVNMSAFNRPAAHGTVTNSSTITVTFPDDQTYNGTLQAPHTIRWSNGSSWTKVVNTVMDLNGTWTDNIRRAVISEGPTSLTVDMSDYDRPAAHGNIVNPTTISVTFPDASTFTGTLQPPNTIRWSNGSAWTRAPYLLP